MAKHLTRLGRLFLALLIITGGPRSAAAGVEVLAADYPVYLFTRSLLPGVPDSGVTLLTAVPGYPNDQTLTPTELETLSRADILASGGLALDAFLERGLGVAKPGLRIIDASARPADTLILELAEARNWYRSPASSRPDPHLFASLSGAVIMTNNLAEALARLDPPAAEIYRNNAVEVTSQYQRLLYDCQSIAAGWSPGPRVIISHGVLSHMATDFKLIVAGVIEGAGEKPSPARLAELNRLARECTAVLADPGGRLDLARIVGAQARLPVAVLDPVASGPADPPAAYFQKVFQTNLTVLNKLFSRPQKN
jgi:ABC-type Zn uptake system ZnuABC Zn-binding protein ZnuA